MKRLFFFLIVVAASVLPQSVWAGAVLSGTTLTITTTAAGQVSGYVDAVDFSSTPKSNVTKIVLDGYFNEADLVAIKGVGGEFTGVTEVDMAEAQFVLTSSGAPDQAYYLLYKTGVTPPAGTTGDRAIVGGTLYKSAQNGTWNELNDVPTEGTTVVDNINTSNTIGYAIGTYGKNNPVAKYVQMQITYAWSTGHSIPVPDTATDLTEGGTIERSRDFVTDANVPLSNYAEGDNVYIYWYYKSANDGSGWKWVEATKAEYDAGSTKYDNPIDANVNSLDNNFAGENRTLRVKVYYTKQGTRNWINNTETAPSNFTDCSIYEYEYRNNHKDGYPTNEGWHAYTNEEWVKLSAWSYYQFTASNPVGWHWEPTTYYNGEGHYINKKYDNEAARTADTYMPTADNQYAVVMGSNSGDGEYYNNNGDGWVDPSTVSNTPHYVDMKFTYWSSTLTKAITSKYADEDINPDIFQNCNALTDVNFKAGVVKGFGDHTTPDNSLTVNIGQNVTAIASNAFIRCTALKAVTFDAGNGSETISGKTYPLALEIRDGAFQACGNLKSVVIPNRVTVIGNDAFKEAGNNVTEFVVEFQRRYDDHGQTQPTDGWLPGMNLAIGSDAFAYCTKLKHISLPIRMTSMGNGIFQNSGLESFEIREDREDSKLETIPENAFLACKLKDINIPRSVNLIEAGAFSNTPTIETIRFQMQNGVTQTPLTIKAGAFSGGDEQHQALKDVYVDFLPTERLVICEYNAFNFTSMVGQTSTSNRQFASLHFPKEAWDYYQGDWKRGLAFRQDNLNAFKDGYHGKWGGISTESDCVGFGTEPINADGKYTKTGYEGENAKYIAPANGWQQFAYSSSDIDILIPWGSFMRTFSTTTPYVIPTYATTETSNGITVQAGDPMFQIYRVTAFSDGFISEGENKSDPKSIEQAQQASRIATAAEVTATDRQGRIYIPSETGLMMVGLINADYIVYFADADFSDPSVTETTYPFNVTETNTNYLYPTCIDDQNRNGRFDGSTPNHTDSKYLEGAPRVTTNSDGQSVVTLNSTIPYPYYRAEDVQFRLFGYSPSINKFIRTEGAWSTRDKAYLKLPSSVFHWTCEYTGDNEGSGNGSGVTAPTTAGTRTITLNFIDDEEEIGTTGIKQVNTTTQRMDSNVFYTLEGVRLNARPTQRGIYIHNGRKVVIK